MIGSLRHGLTSAHGVLGGGAPRYGVYATKSGRIAVAALEPHFEKNLYEHLELPTGSDPTVRFQDRTAEEWEKWAEERALPIVAVRDLY
jgi:crotonobetainyl-CoA:carnitine CoA-transferase CaiB-like acyl-CoA transferase